MSIRKKGCEGCSCRVGLDFCTMRNDMKLAKYKACKDFVQLPKKVKKIFKLNKKQRISNVDMGDENFTSDYLRFIKTGGSWSIREGKRLV